MKDNRKTKKVQEATGNFILSKGDAPTFASWDDDKHDVYYSEIIYEVNKINRNFKREVEHYFDELDIDDEGVSYIGVPEIELVSGVYEGYTMVINEDFENWVVIKDANIYKELRHLFDNLLVNPMVNLANELGLEQIEVDGVFSSGETMYRTVEENKKLKENAHDKVIITDISYAELEEKAREMYREVNPDANDYEVEENFFEMLEEVYYEYVYEIYDADGLKDWFLRYGWTLDRGYGGPNYKERLAETKNWDLLYDLLTLREADEEFDNIKSAAPVYREVEVNDMVLFYDFGEDEEEYEDGEDGEFYENSWMTKDYQDELDREYEDDYEEVSSEYTINNKMELAFYSGIGADAWKIIIKDKNGKVIFDKTASYGYDITSSSTYIDHRDTELVNDIEYVQRFIDKYKITKENFSYGDSRYMFNNTTEPIAAKSKEKFDKNLVFYKNLNKSEDFDLHENSLIEERSNYGINEDTETREALLEDIYNLLLDELEDQEAPLNLYEDKDGIKRFLKGYFEDWDLESIKEQFMNKRFYADNIHYLAEYFIEKAHNGPRNIHELTIEEVEQLFDEITFNSVYMADYENTLGVNPAEVLVYADGYLDELMTDDEGKYLGDMAFEDIQLTAEGFYDYIQSFEA